LDYSQCNSTTLENINQLHVSVVVSIFIEMYLFIRCGVCYHFSSMSIIKSGMYKTRYFILLAILLLSTLIVPFIITAPASAATPTTAFSSGDVTAVWIDRITIEVTISGTTYTFIDGGGLNDDQDYKYQIQGSSCFGEISGFPSGFLTEQNASGELDFDIDYLPPDGECTDSSSGEFSKTIASPENAMISFRWVSLTRIQSVDGAQNWFFSDDPTSPELYFIRENETSCRDKLLVSNDRRSAQFFELDSDGAGGDPPPAANVQDSNCKLVQDPRASSPETNNPPSNISTLLGNFEQAESETELIIGGGAGVESSLCETESGSFGWILCPLLSWASEAIELVEGWISNKLELPSEYYDNEGVKGAWANVRNIAYIILIPVMLLMVISTALGFSVFDAYTVKRSLPRLFAAIIFMALSYEFATLLIEITNIVGQGVAGLIAAPFGGTDALTFQNIFNPNNVDSGIIVVGGGVILAGLGVAAFSVVSIGVLASYLFVAALALLSVFFLLIFRQTILIALIIAAPLAIVSWIFPGNDKMWKIWWQTFSKLLLLYPIVVAAIVTGRAFASIVATSETAGLDSILSILVVITAYIAPFFLIPTIFRYAGGAFANLAGIVNNRSKGVFDRQRKYRGEKKKQNLHDTRTGNRFKGGTGDNLRGRANSFMRGATNLDKAGYNPLTMRSKMRTGLNDQAEDGIKEYSDSKEFRPIKGDDAKLSAAQFETAEQISAELARFDADRFAGAANTRSREDATQQILRAQKATNHTTFQRSRLLAQASTGTGYQDADGNFNSALMLDDINRTYGNDRNGAAGAIAQMRGALTSSGQIAGQAGFATWAGALESTYRAQNNNNLTAAQRTQVSMDAHHTIMDNAIDSSPPSYAIHGKPSSAAAMGEAHARRIQGIATSIRTGTPSIPDAAAPGGMRVATQDDLDAATSAAAGILDAMGQASPQNASAMANSMMGVTIRGSGKQAIGPPAPGQTQAQVLSPDMTVRQMIEDRMHNEQYQNRRRDMATSTLAQAQQQQQLVQQATQNGPGTPGGTPGTPGGFTP
jgi:hypothetical protein